MNAREIIEILNATDELAHIEAKRGRKVSTSALETICAFANTPGVEVGYLIAGVARDDSGPDPVYTAVGVDDADQYQLDLASRCANDFNRPLRPGISVEVVDGMNVVVVKVHELSPGGKPLFFKSEGLPQGAYLRIGSSDQRCREEDLILFYGSQKGSYDAMPVDDTSIADVDESALNRYRRLRFLANNTAEELNYNDEDLLKSLRCLATDGSGRLTVAGVHLFGTSLCNKMHFPSHRVDYIRVPGNEWIPDPHNRFYSVDMRGPLLNIIFRAVDAVHDDLPKGFQLKDGDLAATYSVLPPKALREAIVNAFMHRNYRINSPIAIVRYENRVEVRSPGYSLKPEDQLGSVGSITRNEYFANVFHETNLAEAKGSGIRIMRRLLSEAHLAPPTFESSRHGDYFITRLLLHHFLGEKDLTWLTQFNKFDLSDAQKQSLIFIRDVGAIDNARYRQLVDCSRNEAGADLRMLKELELVIQKGTTRNTYYIPGPALIREVDSLKGEASLVHKDESPPTYQASDGLIEEVNPLNGDGQAPNGDAEKLNGEGKSLNGEADTTKGEPLATMWQPSLVHNDETALMYQAPDGLMYQAPLNDDPMWQAKLNSLTHKVIKSLTELTPRVKSKTDFENLIVEICSCANFDSEQLAALTKRNKRRLQKAYLSPLIDAGRLEYTHPDLATHPNQAYRTPTTEDQDNA